MSIEHFPYDLFRNSFWQYVKRLYYEKHNTIFMNKCISYPAGIVVALGIVSALVENGNTEPEKVRNRVIAATNNLLIKEWLSLPKNTECIIGNGTISIDSSNLGIMVEIACRGAQKNISLYPDERPKGQYLIIIEGAQTDDNGLLKPDMGDILIPGSIEGEKKEKTLHT